MAEDIQLPSFEFFKRWTLAHSPGWRPPSSIEDLPSEEGVFTFTRYVPTGWPTEGIEFYPGDQFFHWLDIGPDDGQIRVRGQWKVTADSGHIDMLLSYSPEGYNSTSLRLPGKFTVEIVGLDDEMLKVRVLEEQRAEDDAHVPTDAGT